MLLPAAPDWRWGLAPPPRLSSEPRETTAWYNGVEPIRQEKAEDWVTPLRAAADRLAETLGLGGSPLAKLATRLRRR
jgi:hypothetical protein